MKLAGRVVEEALIRLHSLRHTLGLSLHEAGVSPNDAAALLGHTTEVYLRTYVPTAGSVGIARAAEALGRVAAGSDSRCGALSVQPVREV